MLQALMFDGLSLDPFTLFDDGWRSAEVGVGGCYVGQARKRCSQATEVQGMSLPTLFAG